MPSSQLGARAATKARASMQPQELPAGRYEVVLEPAVVFDLLQNLSFYAFNGKAVNERRSFIEVGEAQFDPALSIVDDPFDPAGFGLTFDAEGTPKARRMFVDAGCPTGRGRIRCNRDQPASGAHRARPSSG